MINLAEGIEERAIERATKEVTEKIRREVAKEVAENIVINMHELGYTLEQISDVTELGIDDVKTIIDDKVH